MHVKHLNSLLKPLAAGIGWLSGSLAALTALLSALGFLALRAQHDLLGVTAFVPNPPEAWAVEGARMAYNSLLYVFAGCLGDLRVLLPVLAAIGLFVLLNHVDWLAGLRAKTRKPVMQIALAALSALGFLMVIHLFLKAESPSHLLLPQQYDTALQARSTPAGVAALRMHYAGLTALLPMLYVWLRLLLRVLHTILEQTEPEASQEERPARQHGAWQSIAVWGLWGMFLILLLLVPMLYGKMVGSNDYLKVRLVPKQELRAVTPLYEGWLLHEGNGRIVLYNGPSAAEPVHVYKYEHFSEIHILGYENIFATHSN